MCDNKSLVPCLWFNYVIKAVKSWAALERQNVTYSGYLFNNDELATRKSGIVCNEYDRLLDVALRRKLPPSRIPF